MTKENEDLNINELFGNFQQKAEIYSKYRPKYSKNYIKYLIEIMKINKDSLVADIGAGTGIHTSILSKIANKIYAVEPNFGMFRLCEKVFKDNNSVKVIQGTAEKSNLPDSNMDYVTVAQAFHLFNHKKSLLEFKRILRSDGILILIWNSKEHDNELFKESEIVIKKYCPNYQREVHAQKFSADSFCHCFSEDSYTFKYLFRDFTEHLDKTTFIMRTLSASYAITQENNYYDFFKKELEFVFSQHSQNGFVEVPQSTVIYHGKIK